MGDDPELEKRDRSKIAEADVRTVATGGAIQIVGQLSQRGLSMLFVAVMVRVLGKATFGVYRLVAQVLAVIGLLGLSGFNYATMRAITRARARGDDGGVRGSARVGILGASISSLIVGTVLFLASEPLAQKFGKFDADQLSFLFKIGALYVPFFALLQVLRYCTQAYKTMLPSVLAGNILQPGIFTVVGIGAVIAGLEVTGLITILVASVAISAVVAGVLFLRLMSPEERSASPHADARSMIRFALPQAGSSFLSIQSLGGGILILGLAGQTKEAVGLFAIALALQGPGSVFLGGIVNVWAPVVTELYEAGEIRRLGSLYQTINRWVATFSFPIFTALMIDPELFAVVLAGPNAAGAATAVAILAAGNMFYTGTGPTGYLISMTGHPTVNLINSMIGVALYVGLGLWLVPEHGIVAMALVDAGVTTLINSVRVVEAYFLVGIQPFGRTFLKPVLATAAGSSVLLAWRMVPGSGIPLGLVGLACAGVTYILVLKVLGIEQEERHVWERVRNRVGRKRRSVRDPG